MATSRNTHCTIAGAKFFAPVGMRTESANQTGPRGDDRALAGRCAH